jgi:hypothetical protein
MVRMFAAWKTPNGRFLCAILLSTKITGAMHIKEVRKLCRA